MDLVQSLQWVRDNIDRFGGDPGRVLITGQSGGGGKVSTLLAMPSARRPVPPRRAAKRLDHPPDGQKDAAQRNAEEFLSEAQPGAG